MLMTLAVASTGSAEPPRFNFLLHCAGCHQSDGSGVPGTVPNLRNNLGYFLYSPQGRDFLVQVPGSSQSPLDNQDLAAVLNWLLREFSREELPPNLHPYTADEVGLLRSGAPPDIAAERARILVQLHGAGYPVQ
jgi:hypothetical protein